MISSLPSNDSTSDLCLPTTTPHCQDTTALCTVAAATLNQHTPFYLCMCVYICDSATVPSWWACVVKNWKKTNHFGCPANTQKFVLIFWVDKKCCLGGQSKYALFLSQWSDGHLSLTLSHWQLFIAQKIWKKCLFTILLRITWWRSKLFLSCFPYLSWSFDLITSFWTK